MNNSSFPDDASTWNERFAGEGYVFGTEPNAYLREHAALASRADLFVTGDAALLRLPAIGALKIVSPRQFWEVLGAGSG